ncbi:hypothetical protein VE02_03176 [Pseudogymnoascus sp. 03VT05]|nr:hypothetical protein VE02_03176 [Pseudogymnoascus sp. 03VT05]
MKAIPGANLPTTDDIPVELGGIDIPGGSVPNTENIPVEPETSILHPLSSTVIDVPVDPETSILQPLSSTATTALAGSQVPKINIILNSAGIMSIREHTHSRGRIELYFATIHSSYFLFFCLIAPQLLEPVCDTPNESMWVRGTRWPFYKMSTIVWADLRCGILSFEHEWSPIRRFGVFETMPRREPDEEDPPLYFAAEVQRAWNWYCFLANYMFVLARAVIYMLDLLVFVSLSLSTQRSVIIWGSVID